MLCSCVFVLTEVFLGGNNDLTLITECPCVSQFVLNAIILPCDIL